MGELTPSRLPAAYVQRNAAAGEAPILIIPLDGTTHAPWATIISGATSNGVRDNVVSQGWNPKCFLDGAQPGFAWVIEQDWSPVLGQHFVEAYLQFLQAGALAETRPFFANRDLISGVTEAIVDAKEVSLQTWEGGSINFDWGGGPGETPSRLIRVYATPAHNPTDAFIELSNAGTALDLWVRAPNPGQTLFIDGHDAIGILINSATMVQVEPNKLGFFGGGAVVKPNVAGSRGGNAALASLLTALAGLGLITDSTTP